MRPFLMAVLLLMGSGGEASEKDSCKEFEKTSYYASGYEERIDVDQVSCNEAIDINWYHRMNRNLEDELELMDCRWGSDLSFVKIQSVFDFICVDPEAQTELVELHLKKKVVVLRKEKVAELRQFHMLNPEVKTYGKP